LHALAKAASISALPEEVEQEIKFAASGWTTAAEYYK